MLGRQRQDGPVRVDDHSAPTRRRGCAQAGVERQRRPGGRDVAAKGQVRLIIIPREQVRAHRARGGGIIGLRDARAHRPGKSTLGGREHRGEVRRVEPVEHSERQQRSVADPGPRRQRRIERLSRLIRDIARDMTPGP